MANEVEVTDTGDVTDYTSHDLLVAALEEKPLEFAKAFDGAMAARIAELVDAQKQELAQSFLGAQAAPPLDPEDEDEGDEDGQVGDEDEDEELEDDELTDGEKEGEGSEEDSDAEVKEPE